VRDQDPVDQTPNSVPSMQNTYAKDKNVAVKLWLAKRYDEADAAFSAMLLDHSEDGEIFAMRSAVRAANNKVDESMQDALKCVSLRPEWFKGYARVAHANELMGKTQEAIEFMDKALALEPSSSVLQKERWRLMQTLVTRPSHMSWADAVEQDEKEEESSIPSKEEMEEKKELSVPSRAWLESMSFDTEDVNLGYDGSLPPVEELLRMHVEYRVRWMKTRIFRSKQTLEVRLILRLMYNLIQRLGEHVRVPFAIADLCDSIACRSEGCAMRWMHDLEQRNEPDEQMESRDVCFFPARIKYVPGLSEGVPKDSPWTVRTFPFPKGTLCQYANILPNYSLLIDHNTLRGHLAVLVFRLPTKYVVRVAEESWMGLAESSCCFILSASENRSHLIRAAEMTTADYGAMWVWVYPEEDHFTPSARELRNKLLCTIGVARNTTLHLCRKNLEWHIRHFKSNSVDREPKSVVVVRNKGSRC
jgi:hypothetical protein